MTKERIEEWGQRLQASVSTPVEESETYWRDKARSRFWLMGKLLDELKTEEE